MKTTEISKNLALKNLIPSLFLIAIAVGAGRIITTTPESYRWLIGALILTGVLFFALRSPFYAFLFFVITLPLEATLVIEAGFTIRPAYIALLFTFFSLFIYKIFSKKVYGSFKTSLSLPIFLYVGVAFISLIMAFFYPPPDVALAETMRYRGHESRGIIQLFLLIFFALSYFITVYFCSDRKRLITTLKVYIGTALILSIYGIYQVLASHYNLPLTHITNALSTTGIGRGGPFKDVRDITIFRSFATFQEPLNFGHYLLSVVPFLLAIFLFRKKTKLIRSDYVLMKTELLSLFAGVVALFYTRSRGAWAGFIVAILFLILITYKRKILKIAAILTALFLLILIVYNPINVDFYRLDKESIYSDPRWFYIFFTAEFWVKQPALWILGVGYGNYGLYSAAILGLPTLGGANSLPLQVLVETGILGFFALLSLVVKFYLCMFHALKRCRKTYWYPYIVGYLACFTGMMIQHLIFADRLPLYLWVFMGISISSIKIMEKEKFSTEFSCYEVK